MKGNTITRAIREASPNTAPPIVCSLEVNGSWDGKPLRRDGATLLLRFGEQLEIEIAAPFHGDPAPAAKPGPVWQLWGYEVVELFVLGDDERYLELEFGPHGHYLPLRLHGRRNIIEHSMAMRYRATILTEPGTGRRDRWSGHAVVPLQWIPDGALRLNAYAAWGPPAQRHHEAMAPVPGPRPDFHRLESFVPLKSLQRPPGI